MAKIAPRDIASFLKAPFSGTYKAVLFYGPNKGQIRDYAKTCCAMVVDDINDPFNVTQINGEAFDETALSIADEMNAFSMMGGRKLVHIRYATDKISASVEIALEGYNGDNILIIEADDLTPKSSLRKMAEKLPNLACIPCYEESVFDVLRLISSHLQKNGFSADRTVMDYLSNTLSGNRETAFAEIDKLMLYIGFPKDGEPVKQISFDDAVISIGDRTENDMNELCHAIAGGDFSQLDKAFNQLLSESVSEVGMLRATQNYFARLQQVQSTIANGKTRETAIKSLFPPVFFKVKPVFEKHLSLWTLTALDTAQKRLVKTEGAIKKTGAPTAGLTQRTFMALAHQAVTSLRR